LYGRIPIPEWLREWFARAIASRRVLVSAGVLLVAVPTFFTVFIGATEWPWWVRLLVILAWGLVALFVVYGSVRQGERLGELVEPLRVRRDQQRMLALDRILPLLLTHGTGLPSSYEWRVFIYDRDLDRLVASYAPEGVESSTAWEVGQGAVGAAYQANEYVLVQGARVSDETWGLTLEQQERYSRLAVVGAMPIRDERGKAFGVLSAASEDDDGQLASRDGQDKHVALAVIVARVIRDLLVDA
jgi:hypothetical protein